MNETGVFALIAIIGAALLIHALDKYLERRRKVKRLMKIIGALDSCDAQERREA